MYGPLVPPSADQRADAELVGQDPVVRIREGNVVRDERVKLPLAGIRLTDARTGRPCDLGHLRGVHVLSLVRHRY